jgi:hypothetical protein
MWELRAIGDRRATMNAATSAAEISPARRHRLSIDLVASRGYSAAAGNRLHVHGKVRSAIRPRQPSAGAPSIRCAAAGRHPVIDNQQPLPRGRDQIAASPLPAFLRPPKPASPLPMADTMSIAIIAPTSGCRDLGSQN